MLTKSLMDASDTLRCLFWIVSMATFMNGTSADKSSALCAKSEFWNKDVSVCVPCYECKQYPKIPSCDTCPPTEPSDSWRVAAITSLSVLAAVIVFGALLIGVLVHQCKSRRTLREPIEETTGPLYAV